MSNTQIEQLSVSEKDEMLRKLVTDLENQKAKLRGYQSKYVKKRRLNDDEFRKKANQKSAEYCRTRYKEDPDYREHMRERARAYSKAKQMEKLSLRQV